VDPLLRGELMARLNRDAAAIADRFGLRYRVIEPEAPRVKRRYGVCFSDGTIRIRLAHAKTGAPLRYSSLVATLCHELAHLRHFNPGPRFRTFNQMLLEWARSCGIYQPQKPRRAEPEAASTATAVVPRPVAPPCQLTLFG
jgi:predicted metal-dependent hydrolase